MILLTEERYNRLIKADSSVKVESTKGIKRQLSPPPEPTKAKRIPKAKKLSRKPPPPGIPESTKAKRVLKYKRY